MPVSAARGRVISLQDVAVQPVCVDLSPSDWTGARRFTGKAGTGPRAGRTPKLCAARHHVPRVERNTRSACPLPCPSHHARPQGRQGRHEECRDHPRSDLDGPVSIPAGHAGPARYPALFARPCTSGTACTVSVTSPVTKTDTGRTPETCRAPSRRSAPSWSRWCGRIASFCGCHLFIDTSTHDSVRLSAPRQDLMGTPPQVAPDPGSCALLAPRTSRDHATPSG